LGIPEANLLEYANQHFLWAKYQYFFKINNIKAVNGKETIALARLIQIAVV